MNKTTVIVISLVLFLLVAGITTYAISYFSTQTTPQEEVNTENTPELSTDAQVFAEFDDSLAGLG